MRSYRIAAALDDGLPIDEEPDADRQPDEAHDGTHRHGVGTPAERLLLLDVRPFVHPATSSGK